VTDGPAIDIIDVLGRARFEQLPPCADARLDHRSCDYWEDHVRGARTARPSWWQDVAPPPLSSGDAAQADNPFAPAGDGDTFNPFSSEALAAAIDPLAGADLFATPAWNPFAPAPRKPARDGGGPRKLALLERGREVFGSYAKVLLVDGLPSVYAQFGPLSAYPRARQLRDLYPRLLQSPLPAVITCIATTSAARGGGLARRLVAAICEDLAGRGFAAVEAYPDLTQRPDETSAASPAFWMACGFSMAIDDERFPVMRLELD
jgi:GNAT superfamily N-acetyltransferase